MKSLITLKKNFSLFLALTLALTAILYLPIDMNRESRASTLPVREPAIRLATGTTTVNSGLLPYLLPKFEAKYKIRVHVISTGTGQALKLGEHGNVDVVLVHSRADEDKFVALGHGIEHRDVMHNDFVVVGPPSDPARIREEKEVLTAFKKILTSDAKFVSRGDESGTDKKEKSYWRTLGVKPEGSRYVSAGRGMGEVLAMAGELQAYTLADRGTYISYKARTGLALLVQGDKRLANPYGIIAVNPKRHPSINHSGAILFINWITSPEGQQAIADFKVDGQQLFFPASSVQENFDGN